MRAVVIVLACLGCAGEARRVKTGDDPPASHSLADWTKSQSSAPGVMPNTPKVLANLLLSSSPKSAFSSPCSRAALPVGNLRSTAPRMPIGVPKVAYKDPKSKGAAWIDLYSRMYRDRICFLGQQVDDEVANNLISAMLYLDSEEQKPISLYINSPGGSVTAGFAIFDTMRHIGSDVSTMNVGLAASMGSLLLTGGTKGQRLALPLSRTMIHQPAMGQMRGQAEDIKVMAEQILVMKERIVRHYAELAGQPFDKVEIDMDRDNFLSAQEALDYGLIDKVIQPRPMDK
mmetsp:Transcript_118718/g.221927  ORF Transcript_118718/g.221927 Transcript_118718/m.221927 type:complete len:287 (-) Transcript_118718:263-1123(-)